MALVNNERNANTFYITVAGADHQATTDDNLVIKNLKVSYVVITSSGVAELSLKDVSTDANKFRIKLDAANKSQMFDFTDKPLLFPNGIHPEVVTNCVATLVIQETQS